MNADYQDLEIKKSEYIIQRTGVKSLYPPTLTLLLGGRGGERKGLGWPAGPDGGEMNPPACIDRG
jgi:hypothetical protein